MNWRQVVARGDPRLNLTDYKEPGFHYKWQNTTKLGPMVPGQWESFVYHTKFACKCTSNPPLLVT